MLVIDVKRLLVLREVERLGSFSRAAKALGFTQPGVSHHIRQLEREVGAALVLRAGRGVRLTDAGNVLVAHAHAIVARLDLAEQEIADLAGLRGGRVRVAAFPSACATVIPRVMRVMRERHPNLEVRLVEAEPVEALKLLHHGDVDVVVGFEYEHMQDHAIGLVTIPLFVDPLRVVIPLDHHLADRAEIDLVDLADETWITGCDRCRAQHLRTFQNVGLSPEFSFATDDYTAVQNLVAAGAGVALLPSLVFQTIPHPGVVDLPFLHAPTRDVNAIAIEGRRSPATNVALSILQEVGSDLGFPTTSP